MSGHAVEHIIEAIDQLPWSEQVTLAEGLVEQSLETPRKLLMDGVFDLFLKERIYGNGSHQGAGVV